MSSAGGSQPPPPRKGAYSKHVQNLNKDQLTKLHAKNGQEIDLLEDIRTFVKQKSSIEKHYAEALLKLTNSHLNHRLASIPDIQKGDEDQEQEVNVYNLWRHVLEENEKVAKAKLAAVQVFHDEVEKDAKAVSKAKQAKTKQAFERLTNVQKDLQLTVAELDRTKRIYFSEETDALDVKDKAKDAEEKAKGKKKDLKSLFQSKTTLKKHAGILSAKQEELDIRSTGARNDYILSLATANAHQDRYYRHDLQDTMQHLEGDFYEKISQYLNTISRTELLTCAAMQESFGKLRDQATSITRLYNYECYTKVYPSLGQHITYEHEAPSGDEVRIITPSDHDGGYSLNYEARQNASKLNQSVKTIKAYHKRIKACYFHKSKGLKHEPNDTGGPDLDTKINELQVAIRNAETERAKAEARLTKLREGGIAVDEFIDAFVTAYENEEKNERQNVVGEVEQRGQNAQETVAATAAAAVAEQDWGDVSVQQADDDVNEAAPEENWASWDTQKTAAAQQEAWKTNGDDDGAGWGSSVDRQNSSDAAENEQQQSAAAGRAVRAIAVYSFEAQNGDELTVTENEELTILLDECDEEGWLMGLNADGQKGYIPQNYIELQDQNHEEEVGDGGGGGEGDSYDQGIQRQDSYGSATYRQNSYDSQGGLAMQRQDSVGSQQGGFQRQDSNTSQGSYGYGNYGQQQPMGMDTIPEHAELPPVPAAPPPVADFTSSEEDEETESCAMPPAGLPPPPARPPPGPPPNAAPPQQLPRPPSISISASATDNKDCCRALYDYDATGSDEITFEEGEVIKVLKRCPNGVDDGWWLGEIRGKVGLFPSIVVEELSDDDTPDASSMTSPPSMAPPSFSPPPAAAPPPPLPPQQPQPPPPPPPQPEAAINVTAASPEVEKVSDLSDKPEEQQSDKFVTKPVVPCVQVSVDEVPDIPVDEDEDDGGRCIPTIAGGGGGTGGGGGLDVMEIVVTAPTPTVQSPVDEEPPSMPTLPNEDSHIERKEQEEEEEAAAAAAAVAEVETATEVDHQEQVSTEGTTGSGEEPMENKVDSPVDASSQPPVADFADFDNFDTGGVIERHSSADSSVSSSAPSSPSQVPRQQEEQQKAEEVITKKGRSKSSSSSGSSSGSESAEGPEGHVRSSGGDSETESDLPLPPDQLELRQLKKLESMKESTA